MKNVALAGYSGHALVVAETLRQAGFFVFGYFEKKPSGNNPLQLKYLGYEQDINFKVDALEFTVFPAIGDNIIRRKVTIFFLEKGFVIETAISPGSNVSTYAKVQQGTLICKGACINPLASIGKGVIINTGAIIEHECFISDFAHISPGAVLSGNVLVGENSFIGANAVVRQSLNIGNNVVVGAGSVVISNIPDNEVWIGNPARKLRSNT
jgi:sugar O-acyltransferase (sialic acid O-acetyltransferase NeuD family)